MGVRRTIWSFYTRTESIWEASRSLRQFGLLLSKYTDAGCHLVDENHFRASRHCTISQPWASYVPTEHLINSWVSVQLLIRILTTLNRRRNRLARGERIRAGYNATKNDRNICIYMKCLPWQPYVLNPRLFTTPTLIERASIFNSHNIAYGNVLTLAFLLTRFS